MLTRTALHLVQFRSHARSALSCDGRPVAIYGPNGAGKTNILEAISLLSPGRGLRRVAAAEMGRRAAGVGWKITAGMQVAGQLPEIETWAEGSASRAVRIDGKAASQVALGRLARVLWLVPVMDRLWIEGAEGRRRFRAAASAPLSGRCPARHRADARAAGCDGLAAGAAQCGRVE